MAPYKHIWGLLGNVPQQGQRVFEQTSIPICARAAVWDIPWMAGSTLKPETALPQHRHTHHHCLTTGTCWLESKIAPWCLINLVSNLNKFVSVYLFHNITTPASSCHGEVTLHIFAKYGVWGGQEIKAGLSWSSPGCAFWELRKQQMLHSVSTFHSLLGSKGWE